jgi:hypothetical protein
MIELLSSIVVEFSRLSLFRRCGRDCNSKDVVKLNGNKIVAEEALALRLVAIIDVDFVYIQLTQHLLLVSNYINWMCKLSTTNVVLIKKYYAKKVTSVQSREMT